MARGGILFIITIKQETGWLLPPQYHLLCGGNVFSSISRIACLSRLHCSMTVSNCSFRMRLSLHVILSGIAGGKQSASRSAGMGTGGTGTYSVRVLLQPDNSPIRHKAMGAIMINHRIFDGCFSLLRIHG